MNIELDHLAADIEKLSGAGAQPIDPSFIMSQASANVIAMLVFSERLATHEAFIRVNHCIHHCIASMELNPLAPYIGECASPLLCLHALCSVSFHFRFLLFWSAPIEVLHVS